MCIISIILKWILKIECVDWIRFVLGAYRSQTFGFIRCDDFFFSAPYRVNSVTEWSSDVLVSAVASVSM